MGFVTNRWQPVSASPGPIPVPTWEQVKNNVTATTAFDYSALDYTEYLILMHQNNGTNYYELFYAPAFGTLGAQNAGSTDLIIYLNPQANSQLKFVVRNRYNSDVTSSHRYIIYGRKKASWSLVSDKTALPNYTELATTKGYYTPFNYQDYVRRVGGGTYWTQATSGYRPNFQGQVEQVNSNRYEGNGQVYTRLSSDEANWNHITSTSNSVSIADISYSEMFIITKRMQHQYGGTNYYTFQSLYVIPEMQKGTYSTGGYTGLYSSRYTGSYGSITTSATSISASCRINAQGYPQSSFQSLDIYYR